MFGARDAAKGPSAKWRVRLYVVGAVVALAVAPFALIEAYRAFLRLDAEWRFVEKVILQPAPGAKGSVAIRWTTSPRIALVNATAEDTAFVQAIVAAVNEVLEGSGLSARLVEGGTSNVQVYFATQATFDRLAENLGASPFPPTAGFYLVWPGERLDIATAVAVIEADLSAAERQAAIVHELAHTLGLRGHSAVFRESVVFSEGGQRSTATALSPVDRKLLRLLYVNLRPADGWSELRTAYRDYWDAS
ncbi:MAG: DUF2927 domain-containing protein [Alphaproteobacteria bacterium]